MLQPFRPRSSGLTGLALVFVLFFAPSFLFAEPQSGPVMQAQAWEPDMDIRGWWMSEKLDGVRGYWTGEQLVSRSSNVFAVPA